MARECIYYFHGEDTRDQQRQWMRTANLFHFFTFPNSESVIWFFMDDISCTAWITPHLLHYLKNYQVVQVRNVSNGSSKLGSDVNGFHKSSMEFLNWWEISFLLPVGPLLLTLPVTKRLQQSFLLPDVVQSGALSLLSSIACFRKSFGHTFLFFWGTRLQWGIVHHGETAAIHCGVVLSCHNGTFLLISDGYMHGPNLHYIAPSGNFWHYHTEANI